MTRIQFTDKYLSMKYPFNKSKQTDCRDSVILQAAFKNKKIVR